jgi:hypothetical protein
MMYAVTVVVNTIGVFLVMFFECSVVNYYDSIYDFE